MWYQKGLKREDVDVDIGETSLSATLRLPGGRVFEAKIEKLFGAVVPARCLVEVLSTKVEVTLAKASPGLRWERLDASTAVLPRAAVQAPPMPPAASGSKPKDWDRVVQAAVAAEPEEKPEGDAALQQLFQQIYAGATEEQRRAMIKSFTESGGTVLSTNWDEVGKKKVEGKPPEGQEMHHWSE